MRERKTVTSCAQCPKSREAALSFDAITAWVVCVIAAGIEVLSGVLG